MNKENIQKFWPRTRWRALLFPRPHWTRRNFFRLAGAGITASFLAKEADAQAAGTCTNQGMTTINKATNVIFILMAGHPATSIPSISEHPGRHSRGLRAGDGERNPLAHRSPAQACAITNQFSLVRSVQATPWCIALARPGSRSDATQLRH